MRRGIATGAAVLAAALGGLAVSAASASAASVSITGFDNAGPGQMQATVSAALGNPCPPGSNCLGGSLLGVVRPVGSACQYPNPNDGFYYNGVFTEPMAVNGTVNKTYLFSPGTYKDSTGVHPIPEGPIQLCAFVTASWMFGGNVFGGTFAQDQRQASYGSKSSPSGTTPTGKRVKALKKCKKKPKGRKRKKCVKKAKKLPA
jgi:hypothetical protein